MRSKFYFRVHTAISLQRQKWFNWIIELKLIIIQFFLVVWWMNWYWSLKISLLLAKKRVTVLLQSACLGTGYTVSVLLQMGMDTGVSINILYKPWKYKGIHNCFSISSFFCFLVFLLNLGSSAFCWNHEYCLTGLLKPEQLPVPSHYS